MNAMTKSRLIASVIAGALLLVCPVLAGQASLSGPVLGFVFSAPEEALRPLRGVLGSATVGDPVELGVPITDALTVDVRHLVASSEASPELLVLNLETSPASVAPISGARARPSLAAASARGTSAAFYYADSQAVVIVTGFPHNPMMSRSVDLSPSGPLTHMAVSDEGDLLVYSIAEGGRAGVYSWTASSTSSRFVSGADSVGGIAITPNGAAIVTDRDANTVFAVWDVRGGPFQQYLAASGDGVSQPADVAVSASNTIYVANVGAGNIMVLDSSGHILGARACDCELAGLFPLRDSVFRLTKRLDQTVYLLDAGPTEDRILFVPPLSTELK
jgi:WD40 repeat protein